ncbi:MAG: hypothetical protein WC862_00035 [Patescibacteria group bacterium]
MIEVPLYLFLFLYFIFLALFAGFYLAIMYHIISSASFTLASFFASFFIFALTALTFYATRQLLLEVDWRQIVFSVDMSYLYSIVI